jgi:polyhydroxyalkanoate synthesis regulator phasin/phage head maturation protease
MFAISIRFQMVTFILNDESVVTSHGFIVLNSGGKFDRFRSNPVMLDAHNDISAMNVIGKWGNLTVKGSQLLAEPEFDMEDEVAAKISGTVDRGFVKGTSMGLIINDAEMRDMPVLGMQIVVTDWELLEASPVPVPSNKAALRFYAKDGKTVLAANEIKLSVDSIINQKQIMEKITLSVEAAKVLGLGKEPEISDLNAAIMELSANLSAAKTAKEKAESDLAAYLLKQATDLVDLAVTQGKITADKKESYVKLATRDFKEAKDIIDSLPGKQTLSGKVTNLGGNKQAADRESWDYMKWLKEDPTGLTEMAANDPEGHATLKASYKSKY